MTSNNRFARIPISQTIKVLLWAFALIVAYLFALNGRYIKQDRDEYFDKWTKTIITIDKYETIN